MRAQMPLTPGVRLGPYELIAPAGAGGMGEVYKATDTRLNRIVALKVLPHHFAENDEMRQRFEREAQTIAGLNHPNICTLHDVGRANDVEYLVMEFVEGETLSARLERGPIPIDETLRIAIQIGDALDKAHRHGVVHRDFKPGNVMLTKAGGSHRGVPQAKLLDFGLAKLRAAAPAIPITVTAAPTNMKELTMVGSVMGTLQYMSPEQIEGKESDARSDLFAFGATLYEMLTGQKAFQGKSQVSLIAAILEHEPPPMTVLQPIVPTSLEHVVRGCLAKDPEERWQSARDVVRQLTWIRDHGTGAAPDGPHTTATESSRFGSRVRLMWVVGVGAAIALASLAGARFTRRDDPPRPPTVRFEVALPPGAAWAGAVPRFAVSPDGHLLAFAAVRPTEPEQLWLRRLDSLDVRPIAGTQTPSGEAQPQSPFWSPDSRMLGFFVQMGQTGSPMSRLKTIAVDGGSGQTLVDLPSNNASAVWGTDNTILITSSGTKGIQRIPAAGGVPTQVTTLDASRGETAHLWPQFLPDQRHIIFQADMPERAERAIWVGSLDSPDRTMLVRSEYAQFVLPDLVMYTRGSAVLSQRMDLSTFTLIGEPVQVLESVPVLPGNGRAGFSVSATGVFVHATTIDEQGLRQLTWFDRDGRPTGVVGTQSRAQVLRLSPDGRLAAVPEIVETTSPDLWVYDLERTTRTRLTSDPASDRSPAWAADGSRIFFLSNRGGREALYEIDATGATVERRFLEEVARRVVLPLDASRDGRVLVLAGGAVPRDLWILPLSGNGQPVPYLTTPFEENQAALSPDGAWLAYSTNATGQFEVVVQSFPDPSGGKWAISTEGGANPRWRGDGRELFYRDFSNRLVAVPFTDGRPPTIGRPSRLFVLPVGLSPNVTAATSSYQFDVTSDGQRFLVATSVDANAGAASPLTVTLNWR